MEPNENRTARTTVDWGRAVIAGLIATVAITITMALFGQNILKMLGSMIMPMGSTGAQYLVGGVMHLAVGLFYGVLYAWLLGPIIARGAAVKGLVYGIALTGIALAAMPAMSAMMGGGDAANPCNPCGKAATANPCNPCGGDAHAANPCNPCDGDAHAANPCNPCNPCGDGDHAAGGPCNPCSTGGPCNPCGGGGGSPWSGLISLLNHVVYGLVLALVYGR